jgi:hypothetical protein
MQVKLTKISNIGTLFKVWFIQDFVLFRGRFRQVLLYIIQPISGNNNFVMIDLYGLLYYDIRQYFCTSCNALASWKFRWLIWNPNEFFGVGPSIWEMLFFWSGVANCWEKNKKFSSSYLISETNQHFLVFIFVSTDATFINFNYHIKMKTCNFSFLRLTISTGHRYKFCAVSKFTKIHMTNIVM